MKMTQLPVVQMMTYGRWSAVVEEGNTCTAVEAQQQQWRRDSYMDSCSVSNWGWVLMQDVSVTLWG